MNDVVTNHDLAGSQRIIQLMTKGVMNETA